MYEFLCGHMFSLFLGIQLAVELLHHIVTIHLTFGKTAILFSKVTAPFYISASNVQGFHFLYILTNICYFLKFYYLFYLEDICY